MKAEAVQDSNKAMQEEKTANGHPSVQAGQGASPAESVALSSLQNREAAVQESAETAQRTEPLDYKKLYEDSQREKKGGELKWQLEKEELQLKWQLEKKEKEELQRNKKEVELKWQLEKEELQRNKKEVELKLQREKKEKEELQRKKKEVELKWQLEKERKSLGSLRTHYPKLEDRTNSAPHFPINHGNPTVAEMKLEFDTFTHDWIADENFWMAPLWVMEPTEEDKLISCDSEGAAQSHVVALLKAVLRGLALDRVVEVVTNRTLAGVECDVLMVYKPNRLPFSPVEVKKPGRTSEEMRKVFFGWPKAEGSDEQKEVSDGEDVDKQDEKGKVSDGYPLKGLIKSAKEDEVDEGKTHKDLFNGVAGEMLHECGAVKLFGFNYVVGLIATGNHWRITSTHPIKTTNNITECVDRLLKNQNNTENNLPGSPHQGVNFRFEKTNEETEDGTLFASQIVPGLEDEVQRAGEDIVKLTVAYVLMACASLAELLDREEPLHTVVVRPKMSARILIKGSPKTFAFGTVAPSNLNLTTFIRDNLESLYVIHHLGLGGNGNCCLAISRSGSSCCAIKFFHRVKGISTAELAERELRHWKIVYGATEGLKKCCTWGDEASACLVMPYLKPIFGFQERRKLLVDGDIQRALRAFASSGYVHCDIKWRHFGQLGEKIYLSDLGDIKKAKEECINSWVKNSLDYLHENLNEEKQTECPIGQSVSKKAKIEQLGCAT